MAEREGNAYWRQVALGGNTGAAERHAKSQAARMRLLHAAGELFAQFGYRAVSLGMIAERAGMPKGSLTSYFPSKLLLAQAVVAEMRKGWEQLCSRADSLTLDPLATLFAEIDVVLDTFPSNPVLVGGIRLTDDPEVVPDEQESHFVFGEQRALQHLERARAAGLLLPTADVAAFARLIIAVLAGHGAVANRHPGRLGLRERAEESWQLLLPGVATQQWLDEWAQERGWTSTNTCTSR